jgi:hypothetical protein
MARLEGTDELIQRKMLECLMMRDLDRTVTENEIRAAIDAVIVPNGTGEHIQNSDL